MSPQYWNLRTKFGSDGELARALYAFVTQSMVAMREACIDAMVANSDDRKAIEAMHALQPADVLTSVSDAIVDPSNFGGVNLVAENDRLRKQLADKDLLLAFEDHRLRRLVEEGTVHREQRRA